MDAILKIEHLNKYWQKEILDDISLEVYSGEVFGFYKWSRKNHYYKDSNGFCHKIAER